MLTHGTVLRENGGALLPRLNPWVSLEGVRPFAEMAMDPKPMPPVTEASLRKMWPHVKIPDGCWEWTGAIHPKGYPVTISTDNSRNSNGRVYLPHRLMAHWFKHDIPDGLEIDHLCKNKRCVNPDHLEAVTHRENIHRALKRPYCYRGHPQIPENRYSYSDGKERCRPCISANHAEARAARRARGLKRPGRKKSSEGIHP